MSDYDICCYGTRFGDARAAIEQFHIEFPGPEGIKDKWFCSAQCLADYKQRLRDEEGVEVIEPYLEDDTDRFESYEDRARREEQRLASLHDDPGIALSDSSYGNRGGNR